MKRAILALLFSVLCWTQALAGVNCNLPFVLQNNTVADANQVMANFNQLTACLLNAAGAGANTDITSLNALSSPVPVSGGGSSFFLGGTSTGSGNVQAITIVAPTNSNFALTNQYSVIFQAGATNTGAMQVNVQGTGPVNLYRRTFDGLQALTGGEIIAGTLNIITYDGTQWELMSSSAVTGGLGPQVTIPSAATVDLGTAPTHNVIVSGTTPITSFGKSASTTFPLYFVGFTGITTITYNATACPTVGGCIITPGNANIVTAPGDTAWLLYLGPGSNTSPAQLGNWQVLFYQKATGAAVVNPTPNCGFNNLQWANGSSATTVTISWASASLTDPATNVAIYSPGVMGKTLNVSTGTGTAAAGGMDGGSATANSFVYMYGISNGTLFDVLGSTNPTAPNNMPTGTPNYHYFCRLGAIRTQTASAGSLFGMYGKGAAARYVPNGPGMPAMGAYPSAASGSTAGALAQIAGINNYAPPSASMADLVLSVSATGTLAEISAASMTGVLAQVGSANTGAVFYRHLLDATGTVFYVSSGGSAGNLAVVGYVDQVNAN